MSNRRSPSGELMPVIDVEDENANIPVVAAATYTLVRKVSQFQTFTGVIAADTNLNLPADPKNGDEVMLSSSHTGAGNIIVSGNGHNVGAGLTDTISQGLQMFWYKFNAAQNIWLILSS